MQCVFVVFIVDIGRLCDIEIVVEGVEMFEYVKILCNFGCYILQGYVLVCFMSGVDFVVFVKVRIWFFGLFVGFV